jgi:hypothetical protein
MEMSSISWQPFQETMETMDHHFVRNKNAKLKVGNQRSGVWDSKGQGPVQFFFFCTKGAHHPQLWQCLLRYLIGWCHWVLCCLGCLFLISVA